MSGGFEDRHLRDLERHLASDDALFVDAFRTRSDLMTDAPQLQADLRMLAMYLKWAAATIVLMLTTAGAYGGATGLCILLLASLTCARRRPHDRSGRAGRSPRRALTRRRDSRSA